MKKWLKRLAVVTLLAIIAICVALYQGDLPKHVVDAKYTSPTSQFLTLDSGAKIHFRDEGFADGQPVVLIHGFGASLHTWEPWVEMLGSHYRVVTLDLPAHGLTGKVPDGDYSVASQIKTVDAVVQHLGLDRFVLGGNSMGGGVTWRYTAEHPEKVKAMILVDAVGLPQWSQEVTQVADQANRQGPLVFRLMRHSWFRTIARNIDPYHLTKQGLLSAYTDKSVVTDEMVQRYYELALREGSREAIMDRFADFAAEANAQPVDPTQFRQPTLILWGSDDALINVKVANMFAEALPNSQLVIYDNVGHIPMEEVAEMSAMDVLEFLSKLQNESAEFQEAVAE